MPETRTVIPNATGRWQTIEPQPREIMVKGRSAMDPGCLVGVCEGRTVWIYPTGFVPDLGRDVFALPENGGDCCPFAEAQAELRRCKIIK